MAVVALLAAALVITASVPASAATWIQLRYWPSNILTTDIGNTANSGLFGLTLRRDFMGGQWAGSFNFDTGGVSNWTGGGGTQLSNRFWNVNLHRNFPIQSGMASLYVGYGGHNFEDTAFPFYVRVSGFRVGADVKINFRNNLYVVGDVSFTPRQTGEQLNFNLGGVVSVPMSVGNYRVGLGYMANAWGAEVGYRWIHLHYDPVIMCGGSTPCGINWTGPYIGVNIALP